MNNTNSVSVGKDTTVQALGDINLLAGKDREGARNYFKLKSEGDDLNATAIPISSPRGPVVSISAGRPSEYSLTTIPVSLRTRPEESTIVCSLTTSAKTSTRTGRA